MEIHTRIGWWDKVNPEVARCAPIERATGKVGSEEKKEQSLAYLLMRIPELVLQYGFAIDQRLHFIGKGVEGLGQSLGELEVVHPTG